MHRLSLGCTYLQTAKIARLAAVRLGGDGRDFWMVRARLAQLNKDVTAAESVFLEQGKVDQAVEMYQVRTSLGVVLASD
jgi:intraflagellar transport protein 172